jgi:hypothetical protein
LAFAIIGFLLLLGKYTKEPNASTSPRYAYLGRLLSTGELLYLFSLVPLLGMMHRGGTVNDRGRHFGDVCLVASLSMVILSVVIRGAWWVFGGMLASRDEPRAEA